VAVPLHLVVDVREEFLEEWLHRRHPACMYNQSA
jgi:hypothetical protein